MGTFDLPSQVWAYIFMALALALVIALRITDKNQSKKDL